MEDSSEFVDTSSFYSGGLDLGPPPARFVFFFLSYS